MKILVFLCLITSVFYSCQSSKKSATLRERATDSVTAYMKQNLDDPASYQPVKFGTLDTTMSNYTQDDKYFTLKSMSESELGEEADEMLNDRKLYSQRSKANYYKNRRVAGLKGLDSLQKNFKPKLSGYIMLHSYRAKNKFGALTLHEPLFRFRKDLSIFRVQE
jgi:hypothetical protein